MEIAEKTKEELTEELEALRLRIAKLKRAETERRRAEEALQQSNRRFNAIAQNALEWIWEVDAKGKYTYSSAVVEKILGYKPEEVLGKHFYDLFHPDDREELKKAAFEVFAKKQPFRQFVNRNIHKNGEIVWLSTSGVPILDEKENLIGYRGADVDITEHKQVDEALQAEKNKLESVIDAMEDGLTIQDKDYNIIYQNELVRKLFGERLGEKCYRVYEGKEKLCDGCPVKKAFRDGKSHTSERRVVLPSGEVTFWENTANPVRDAKGDIVSCLEITRNITGRKRAGEALRDSEEKFSAAFRFSGTAICITSLKDNKFIEINEGFTRFTGYTREETIGRSAAELGLWVKEEELKRWLSKLQEQGRTYNEEFHSRSKSGEIRIGLASAEVINIGGEPCRIVVIADITERKRAEEALREAEEKYKNFVEATSDMLWESDEMGMFTFVSPRIKDILGYEADEVVGKKRTLDFAPEEEKRKWLGRFKEVNAKRKPFSGFEITHLHKNGSPVVLETSGAPFTDSAGNFKGFIGVNKDITERKQTEEALRESQKFSSSLLENSPNPIFVVNPDTSVKYVNPAFEKLTGFTLAEITGRKAPYPWWPEEKREEITASFKNVMVTGGRRSEKVFQKKNGERFFVALNSAPIVHEGKLLYFLINWLDLTERKRAEKERQEVEQKAHLASRLASVGEMASGIAHEINNPLTAVIGFAQLLMDTDLPDEVKEDISVIHKEAQRAAGVARNLLTFARKHTPTKQPTNLNSIIEGVLKLRAYEQSVSNIKVNTRFTLDLPEVMADYSQMQQVFVNIILNAESAMLGSGNGGTLTVATKKVSNVVRASFADTGPGITKENLNRIFDPFFTTKEVGKGTGLGLSVCHGIVAEHGGRIYARSRLGNGATFIVELPTNAH